jgi:hypothetical protein
MCTGLHGSALRASSLQRKLQQRLQRHELRHRIPSTKRPPTLRWILDGGSEQLLTHSKMYTIGDKYDVPGLKELAKGKFQSVYVRFSESEDFVVAAEHAFSTTMDDDEGLRKIVRDILMARKGMLVRPNVKAFLVKEPDLMYEILIKATQ